jgi:hypothetical protein
MNYGVSFFYHADVDFLRSLKNSSDLRPIRPDLWLAWNGYGWALLHHFCHSFPHHLLF